MTRNPLEVTPEKAAAYARCEERATDAARRWLATHPDAAPRVKSILPVEHIIASWTDAVRVGLVEANDDGRALVAAMLAGSTPRDEPTLGQIVRAIDAARRVRP